MRRVAAKVRLDRQKVTSIYITYARGLFSELIMLNETQADIMHMIIYWGFGLGQVGDGCVGWHKREKEKAGVQEPRGETELPVKFSPVKVQLRISGKALEFWMQLEMSPNCHCSCAIVKDASHARI